MSTQSRHAKAFRRLMKREARIETQLVWNNGAISAYHHEAAERFKRLFVPVPLSDVEKNMPDPDYGL